MAEAPATVFVIDDDISVRDAIEGIVRSVGLDVETFPSTGAFLKRQPHRGPACLVLDVRLPDISGLEFQSALAKAQIEVPIVFVTGFGDVPMSVRAMKAGAVEFLTKPFRDQELLDAIHHALEHDRQRRRERSDHDALRQKYETLTERERQVMAMVADGARNRDIARHLGTSEITVKVQRGHLMRKMEAMTAIDLARMADKLGLRAER